MTKGGDGTLSTRGGTIKQQGNEPVDVSGLIIMSPLTTRFCRLGRSEAKSCFKPSVLVLVGQKPWKTSAFSHHVCTRISSPERPSIFMASSMVRTVSRWELMTNAKGMTRLYAVSVLKTQPLEEGRTCKNVAVCALTILLIIAAISSGRTGKTDSPALLNKWIIRSPTVRSPYSSLACKIFPTRRRTISIPPWPVVASV
jgi:hypothetical protein